MARPERVPLMTPIYESIVGPWTPENPRHDHQLIFPLDESRLMLVWSEYFSAAPSHVFRNQFAGPKGGFSDQAPCQISAKISWGGFFFLFIASVPLGSPLARFATPTVAVSLESSHCAPSHLPDTPASRGRSIRPRGGLRWLARPWLPRRWW